MKSPTRITTRGLNNEKINELNHKLEQMNWTEKLKNRNVNEQYDTFQDILVSTIDEAAPYHTITISSNKITRDPWLSVGLHKCLKKQQLLYRKTLKGTSTNHDQIKYKTYRNKLKQILRRANVDSYKCLWEFIGCYTHFSGLQSSLGITNVNRSHNKPLELIETI